jgi:hypothetical protein
MSKATDHIADDLAVAGAFEDVSKELGEQVAGDESAEDADGLEHFGEAGTLFGGFGFRELLPHEHDAVDDGGDEVERELGFQLSCIRSSRYQPTMAPITMPAGQEACRMLR